LVETVTELERVLGELEETPHEPLKEDKKREFQNHDGKANYNFEQDTY
jgi:hypothetical protein